MKHFSKTLLLACSVAFCGAVNAEDVTVKGEVLEVKDVDSYTYLRMKTAKGEVWSAVLTAPVKKGEVVTIENAVQMDNFQSNTLKKTFPVIYFGSLVGAPEHVAPKMGAATAPIAKADLMADVKVPKASGAQAYTVAEIINKSTTLKDKNVVLRARVVKVNTAILGKNWLHVRDGSGSEADATNDLLVTSADTARLGDTVLINGIVRADKDFGGGYAFKVMVEGATLKP